MKLRRPGSDPSPPEQTPPRPRIGDGIDDECVRTYQRLYPDRTRQRRDLGHGVDAGYKFSNDVSGWPR